VFGLSRVLVADWKRCGPGEGGWRRLGNGTPGDGCASVTLMRDGLVLDVRGLGRRYGEFDAVQGVGLTVAAGECVAVIGHNGSGKTTLVRLIAGLLEPSSGSVRIVARSIHDDAEALGARAALAAVPDTPSLYEDLTVREHLQLVAIAHGVAGEDGVEQRITQLLDQLGLANKADARPGALSRGMRQKAQLACALVRPHRLLMLDEPVVGLDPAAQRTLRQLLLEAKRNGVAVVLTTHQLDFARGIADRALVLADGVVVADGAYGEVVDGSVVREYGLR
jgi:ABC-2 type transport system ATP-binding protein